MKARLHETYNNEFLTTMTGLVFRKTEWTEFSENDVEVKRLLEQPGILELQDKKLSEEKMIKDDIPKQTIKEVVTPTALKENKEALKEAEEPKKDGDANKESTDKENKL